MNLKETFNSLSAPKTDNRSLLNALTLDEFPFVKIAINHESSPVVLISPIVNLNSLSLRNIRLKYLELTHNLECKIIENNAIEFKTFTVITFRSSLEYLQQYFLGIVEMLIRSLSQRPTDQEVSKSFLNFIEVFRAMADVPTKTLQGLWAELFVIETCKDPIALLNYWHSIPEEKYDFNADKEKLEIKSSCSLERIHTFSSEQLNPPANKQVLIASIFVRQNTTGINIVQLSNSIQMRIGNHVLLVEKLFTIIARTLGNTIEQSIKIKFDYALAKSSLRFFQHKDIQKIEKVHIPNGVSGVKFKSDLTTIEPVDITTYENYGVLFKSI